MSCNLCGDSMMKHFDRKLNDIENAQFKQHLKTCESCNKEFAEFSSVLECIENDFIIEPPHDFELQVMDRIKAMELAEKKKPSVLKILLLGIGTILTFLAASALVYSILGISVFKIMNLVFGDSPVFSALFESAGSVFEGGITSIVDYAGTILKVGLVLAKTHYYFIVLVIVILFAFQWMVVDLIRQNLQRQKHTVSNTH